MNEEIAEGLFQWVLERARPYMSDEHFTVDGTLKSRLGEVSQRKRKRVERSFGWIKMIGMLKKVKLREINKVGWLFTFT